jgi:hypothetical protein
MCEILGLTEEKTHVDEAQMNELRRKGWMESGHKKKGSKYGEGTNNGEGTNEGEGTTPSN